MSEHVTVLEINAQAVLHNLDYFKRKLNANTKILAVVKAFGYGSESVEIAKILHNRVDYFATAYTHEAITLRNAGIKTPILILHPQLQNIELITDYYLEPALYNFKIFDAFLKLADQKYLLNYPIHIKFNTGLNRLGFTHLAIPALVALLKKSNNIKVKSVFSHLAASEDLNELEFSNNQIGSFVSIAKQLIRLLKYRPLVHILNTSGVINYNKAQFDMVRIGIGLYGFGNHPEQTEKLKNTHTLKSIISQIHFVKAGETIGYNRAFTANRPTKSATIPIGHADGISRKLGNKNGFVLIDGQWAPIIGNVCMDMIMADVTDINCEEGDQVIIFKHQQHIEQISQKCETIPYEILTAISQRIKRVIKM
ncbi:MAG: alanine racemase [Tenacibaculum sp.]